MTIRSLSPKDPNSEEWFSWDFKSTLRPGQTIDELIETVIDEGDDGDDALEIIEDTSTFDGTVVSAKFRKGTLGQTYTCRATVTTEDPVEKLDHSFKVTIVHQ
ncbi:MAG TPA: hypothetical protein VHO25_21520 [Polyangiaceae bacterium]|nr:hypothetical protein [Polyangiaceae bacterium]